MRRLMLLRHAKSDWSRPGGEDHDRPLSERGKRSAPRVGAYLVRHGLVPDRILCSTAARTRATLDLVAKSLPQHAPVLFDDALYLASAERIVEIVRKTPREARVLLVIGHNPGMAEAAVGLIASGDVESRERLHEKFPTAGLAVIDFPTDDWSSVHPRSGRLDRFIVPRQLDDVTE